MYCLTVHRLSQVVREFNLRGKKNHIHLSFNCSKKNSHSKSNFKLNFFKRKDKNLTNSNYQSCKLSSIILDSSISFISHVNKADLIQDNQKQFFKLINNKEMKKVNSIKNQMEFMNTKQELDEIKRDSIKKIENNNSSINLNPIDQKFDVNIENETLNKARNESLKNASGATFRSIVNKQRLVNKAINMFKFKRESTAVKNEQKAVKVLGILFVIFVIAWAPFAVYNIMSVVCTRCNMNQDIFNILTWLGYISSAINPLIYNAFNEKFRYAFKKILLCQFHSLKRKKYKGNSTLIINSQEETNFQKKHKFSLTKKFNSKRSKISINQLI